MKTPEQKAQCKSHFCSSSIGQFINNEYTFIPIAGMSEDGELLKQRIRTEAGRFRESLGARPLSRIPIEDLASLELHSLRVCIARGERCQVLGPERF